MECSERTAYREIYSIIHIKDLKPTNLSFHIQKLERELIKSKASRRNNRAEINETENKINLRKYQLNQKLVLWEDKIGKPLTRLQKIEITNTRMKEGTSYKYHGL